MLSRLVFRNFRNYERLRVEVDRPLNLLVGANGQGKTGVLEGIFYLSVLRSFRTSRISSMRRLGTSGFYVGGEWRGGDDWKRQLEVDYEGKRVLRVDGTVTRKASEFIRRVNAVAFTPEDVVIVTGQSGTRRNYFDMLASILDATYLRALLSYKKALQSRNVMLRSDAIDSRLFDSYERLMAENAAVLADRRRVTAALVDKETRAVLELIGKKGSEFRIFHKHQPEIDDAEAFARRLRDERGRDRGRGYTGSGPQMDDFEFIFDGKNARNYASTGQCRLLSLCLKMAKMNILIDDDSSKVVVLIDDVAGELDAATRAAFYAVVRRAGQMFFTFTETPADETFAEAAVFDVANGNVKRRNGVAVK